MFEQLFGSKTRAKLIKLFLENPDKAFYVRELTRMTNSMINSVRRELQILKKMDIIYVEEEMIKKNIKELNLPQGLNTKKFFKLNKKNVFHKELRNIFEKNNLVKEKKLADEFDFEGIYLVVLAGAFIDENGSTDALIVADLNREKLMPVIEKLKKRVNKEINYTIFDPEEYFLRRDIKDRFLHSILDNSNKITVLDKLKKLNNS